MNGIRGGVLVGLLVCLAACATAAQQRAQTLVARTTAANQQLRICAANVHANATYQIVASHIPPNPMQPTPAQLSDPAFPTPAEIEAMGTINQMIRACRVPFIYAYMTVEPRAANISISSFQQGDDEIRLFMRGKTAWGAYTASMQQIITDYNRMETQEAERMNAQLGAENAVQLSERERGLQALGQGLQSAGTSAQVSANAYGEAARAVAANPPPAPPVLPPPVDLSGMYSHPPPPHGCIALAPVPGPGLNPCPTP